MDDSNTTHSMHDMEDIVIQDNNAFLMAMGSGSRIEIHAADSEKESWTELSEDAEAGTNELKLQEATGWEVGDKIAIATTTDQWDGAEEFEIVAVSDDGMTVTLNRELEHTHRGQTLEYDNGLDPNDPDYLE